MNLLDDVYGDYRATASSLVRVPGSSTATSYAAIKIGLPDFFRTELASRGLDKSFRCYGGLGDTNWNFAKIPWVASCLRSITSSVSDGYFIVLLFREDMSGCWLSLNQGFTRYRKTFVTDAAARHQATIAAETLARLINIPNSFVTGPISLGATTSLGKGYEAGAVLSRYYPATESLSDAELSIDFNSMVDIYGQLAAKIDEDVVALLPNSEGPFQAAAAALAEKPNDLPKLPPGPLVPPPIIPGKAGGRRRRNPSVAAIAINNARHQCEVDSAHVSFTARTTQKNFVEAHHLVPIGQQARHPNSLDVPENVVALCPNCHRMIHHGLARERMSMAIGLFKARLPSLRMRGIPTTEPEIRDLYRHELEEG